MKTMQQQSTQDKDRKINPCKAGLITLSASCSCRFSLMLSFLKHPDLDLGQIFGIKMTFQRFEK